MTPFHLELAFDDHAARMQLSGDVDLLRRDDVRSAIDRVLDTGPTCWVDLAGLTFADVTIVRELLRGQHRANARGACLLVVAPTDPAVLQPFDRIGVLDRLPFVSQEAAA